MSYSEYTWQTGETITAEKLNNLEGGVQEALAGSGGGGGGDLYQVDYRYDTEVGDALITIIHNDETIDANNSENFAEVYRILTEERWIPTSSSRSLWGIAYIVEDGIAFYNGEGTETIIAPPNIEP